MYLRITATFLILTIVIACNGEAVTYEPVLDQEIPLQANGPVDPIAAASATRGGIYTAWGGPNPKSLNVWLDPWALHWADDVGELALIVCPVSMLRR